MQERQHGYDKADHVRPAQHDDVVVRGRHSSQLEAPQQPLASGLIARKAEGNGVAAHAEAAVGEAASSSGSQLPAPLMRKFEASLGADLSGVRVHTGGASATAASAVSARAYATGQDIHFGAGQYDPNSAGGQHLIAHEVAHTVQQRGGGATRQHKLEVSGPADAHEHEADRAADAMVAGQPFKVGAAATAVHRDFKLDFGSDDPVKDARKAMPAPFNWGRDATGAEITGPWQGLPVYHAVNLPPGVGNYMAQMLTDKAKAAFTQDWTAMQSLYNKVATEMTAHHDKAVSAQKLGLVDVNEGPGNLEANVARTQLPGASKTIGQAFNADNTLGGASNYNAAAMSREDRLKVDKAKKDVDTKNETANSKADTALNKQGDVRVKGRDLQNAMLDLEAIGEEASKEQQEREIEALKKAASIVNDCIGAAGETVTAEKPAAGANAAGVGMAKVVNTLLWDTEIMKIQGQLAFISGKLTGIKKAKTQNAIASAKDLLAAALRDVQTANRDYNAAMRDRTAAYQELATQLQGAAVKSGSPGDAAKIAAAVQAVPAIELLIDSASKIAGMIVIGGPSPDSAQGAGLADPASQQAMVQKRADLKVTQNNMAGTAQTWRLRLNSVNSLIGGAR